MKINKENKKIAKIAAIGLVLVATLVVTDRQFSPEPTGLSESELNQSDNYDEFSGKITLKKPEKESNIETEVQEIPTRLEPTQLIINEIKGTNLGSIAIKHSVALMGIKALTKGQSTKINSIVFQRKGEKPTQNLFILSDIKGNILTNYKVAPDAKGIIRFNNLDLLIEPNSFKEIYLARYSTNSKNIDPRTDQKIAFTIIKVEAQDSENQAIPKSKISFE